MTERKKRFQILPEFIQWLKRTRLLQRIIKWVIGLNISAVILLLLADFLTGYIVRDKIYTDIKALPNYENALVLGTAKYYAKGTPNLYYKYRLETALELYKKGKVKKLLLSGDNKTPYYNEPKTMSLDLRRMGVQNVDLLQDFAGYRTLDSVVRAAEVYHLQPFVIITQEFHCERALFIAKTHNIDAVCFAAKYPEGHIKVRLREILARIGMIWDYVSGVKPETLEKVGEAILPATTSTKISEDK